MKFAASFALCIVLSGCGPAMHSPAPQWPPGGASQFQPPVPIPAQQQPQTFEQPTPNSLDDVATVPPSQVLKLPPRPRDVTWHEVRPGDTLTSIAQHYSVTVDAIMDVNAFDKTPTLKVGQQIRIP